VSGKPEILLSVLIPSIPSRLPKLTALLEIFAAQADPRLEVMVFVDNKQRHLGAKRNALMDLAAGRYVMHCDDDDSVTPDFFVKLLPHFDGNYDLIAYNAFVSFNGSPEFKVTTMLGAECEQPKHLPEGRYSDITRPPWHWSTWRTDFARRFKFPAHYDGAEDWFFLKQALPAVHSWKKIEATLFYHRYDNRTSEFAK
jgi:glycosyltransferase involved in cell wall biosynthesis